MSPSPLFASGQVRPHRGAWRHTLLPLCLVGALGGSLGGGAYALWKAYQPERLALQERQPLQALHPWLPGATLSVPAPTGLWATQLHETALLLARAQPDGPPQTVSLCHQLSGGGGDALSLYPMALVAGLPKPGSTDAATQRRLSRNPVVLPSALGEGLPRVWVQGRLAEGSTSAQLHLRVAAAPGAPRTWQVGLARLMDAPRADGAETYALGAETWLLWSPQPAATDAALDGTAARYAHGVRIRRVAQADCPSGALEWQLFDASANASAPRQAVLRALPLLGDALAPALRMSLPAGTYTVPQQPAPALEDRQLFEQALQAGLITPLPDGRLSVAPSDADAGAPPLLKPLYRTANGEHVRAQVRQANQFRHWLGVRLRAVGAGALPVSGQPADWRATAGGELLAVQTGLPDVATRLHSQPPEGWTPWQRVLAPQSWLNPVGAEAASAPVAATPEPVQLRLPLLPGQGGRFQVMVLGRVLAVQGARVLGNEAACTGPGCGQPDWLQTLTLEPLPNTQALVLTLVDQPQFNRLKPAAAEQLRVQWQGEALRWVDPPTGSPRPAAPAQVTLLARDGQALYDQGAPTALARQWGLAPLVGLAPAHGHSLAGVLARLGQQGHAQVQAVTTLEPQYQATLQAVLACIGQHDGQWQAAQQRCERGGGGQPADARRVSAAVLMDAHSGELLAVASGQALPANMATQELLAFDAFNPGNSPLRVAGLQHTGGVGQSPGSSFKLVDGLMLEAQARQAKPVRDLVEGLTAQALEARAKSAEQPFVMDSACYPAPCDPHRPHVQNFNEAPASRYVRDGHFGLKDALRNSVNTWFSWAVEQTDRTARAGHADARPLGRSALEAERPLQAMMARLGMTEALRLDGDLLPETHAWQPGDVLQATPTTLDPLMDVHNIRQQALGLRMQTTPLHMARVAAAVATGRAPAVHLLHQLNGETAHPAQPERLGLELGRLRAGMQEVVRAGTAQGAFASHALDAVRAQVYGKTGSAPLAGGGSKALCAAAATTGQPLPLACLNNAWFVGYLTPGALPGEGRTLAFAVQVSFSAHTGGAQAAPVVAQWLQTLWAAQTHGTAARP